MASPRAVHTANEMTAPLQRKRKLIVQPQTGIDLDPMNQSFAFAAKIRAAAAAPASYYYSGRLERADALSDSSTASDPPAPSSAGFLLLSPKGMTKCFRRQSPRIDHFDAGRIMSFPSAGSRLRRGPCGLGPAVRAAGRASRHARRLRLPRRHRPAAAVASGRSRRRGI